RDNIQNKDVIYVYYLITKLRKYAIEQSKNLNLYKMMNTVIRYMNTIVNVSEEINNVFSFFVIFFENLEIYAQTDIFNIIIVLQKLSFYVKSSLKRYFDKNLHCLTDEYKKNDVISTSLKFENWFFYFILNLILYCKKYNQIKNINILSSSVPLIQLLVYSIQFTNNDFKSLAIFILSLLILPYPQAHKTISPLLMILSTSFDKCSEDILLSSVSTQSLGSINSYDNYNSSDININNNTNSKSDNEYGTTDEDNIRKKYVIRKNLFYPLITSKHVNLRVSALSLLLSLLLTNEWNDPPNDLLFAIINVSLLSTVLNLKIKSFCFNFIYSFRPFFLRNVLPLNKNEKIIIHKLFFMLLIVKIKPLWFDLKNFSGKILKILINVVTKKDLDLMTFNCISSLAYEVFIKNKNENNMSNNNSDANKNVIENLEEYLQTYKKNVKTNDDDIYQITSFNKFKGEHINYDVILAILNTTRLLLYK
ncbi:conserved protein, unknown function, partial [Hepatocystis sp. ex Piliocolobus tephrosceles]